MKLEIIRCNEKIESATEAYRKTNEELDKKVGNRFIILNVSRINKMGPTVPPDTASVHLGSWQDKLNMKFEVLVNIVPFRYKREIV